jgi:hypothetical protein
VAVEVGAEAEAEAVYGVVEVAEAEDGEGAVGDEEDVAAARGAAVWDRESAVSWNETDANPPN